MTVASTAPPSRTELSAPARERTWPLYAVLLASLFVVVGLIWDISWHRTIGRDTFWSPPHVLEQLGAVIAGVSCGWLVLTTTFRGSPEEKARTVGFWGFRGPLGAWVCIWGTLMMITSAPFDDWWHNAYGLDVTIISPPHLVLAWGFGGILIGAMLMALARQNRTAPEEANRLGLLYLGVAAVALTMHATTLTEEAAFPNQMHSARFYVITAIAVPGILAALARPSRRRWPATTIAALYMGLVLVLMWTLQLFPATPKLAPIFNAVTHMVPPPFPLLLVFPALAVDLVLTRERGGDWSRALVIGVGFVAAMLIVHWFFAEFMLSSYARNFVFAADKWDYNIVLGDWRHEFWGLDVDPAGRWDALKFWRSLGLASVIAALSARIGLWAGRGMARVQR